MTTWPSASKARSPPSPQVPRKREQKRQFVEPEGCAAGSTPRGGGGVRSRRLEGARRGGARCGPQPQLDKGKASLSLSLILM